MPELKRSPTVLPPVGSKNIPPVKTQVKSAEPRVEDRKRLVDIQSNKEIPVGTGLEVDTKKGVIKAILSPAESKTDTGRVEIEFLEEDPKTHTVDKKVVRSYEPLFLNCRLEA